MKMIETKENNVKTNSKANLYYGMLIGIGCCALLNVGRHVWTTPVDEIRKVDNVHIGGNYYTVEDIYKVNCVGVKIGESEQKVLGSLVFDAPEKGDEF